MNSTIDQIKNKLDIIDFIGGYLKLQKAGRNYRAFCPFHSEKNPSFMVSPERQIWHCFSCSKGGSVFDFLMEMEGLEFSEALQALAQRTGVVLKKTDPQLKSEKTKLYEICQLANDFFVKQLESQAGKKIQGYLSKRGLDKQTIKSWQIGYAPNSWQGLLDFLNGRGYSDDYIEKAGLAIKSDKPGARKRYYDRFRDRIMFPLFDLNGQIVGFTGRENPNSPDSKMGKYINTPNTLIYDKSRLIYGLDRAKLALRKENLCLFVEGQMDVIMSHQAGFDNAVASSGTALTESQLSVIKRYTDNLAMAFDMDLAGQNATKRAGDLAVQMGFDIKVIDLPEGKDPADCIRTDPSLWQKSVKKAVDLIEFYLTTAIKSNDPATAQGKKEISKIVLPIIKQIPNRVEQAHWIQELANRIKIQESILLDQMAQPLCGSSELPHRVIGGNNEDSARGDGVCQHLSLEEYLLGLILSSPKGAKYCRGESCELFADKDLAEIFKIIQKAKGKKFDIADLTGNLPVHLADKVNYLIFRAEDQNSLTEEFSQETEIQSCFSQLKKRQLKQKLDELNIAIKEAEINKDKSFLKKLTEEFNQLAKQMA